MCASVYSTLLLFICTTLTISIMCGTKMATEGLPLVRRERGAEPDILAGADFLSVFMESSLRQAYRETTTSAPTYPTFTTTDMEIESTEPLVRTSRSTNLDIAQQNDLDETTISAQDLYTDNTQEPSDNLSDGVIVAVRVSSSIGKTLQHQDMEGRTPSESYTETTTMYPDQNFVASEDHPSIVAEANKSEFSVEESEPIMRNTDLDTSEFSRSFPASVHALPRPQNLPFNPLSSSDYLDREIDDSKRPYHQTIVYHNNPRQPGRARSVSYSTVIQTVPHGHEKNWANDKANQNERHERNYDNANNYRNNFEDNEDKRKLNETAPPPPPTPVQSSVAESNNYFVTSKPLDKPTNWEKPEDNYEQPSTRLTSVTTERNWELHEKRYQPPTNHQQLPKVYGVPEQNYEVDEAISVVTNGRAHGIQPSQPPTPKKQEVKDQAKKDDDNQKVGYVVEGRNYRKYRVEERTADGFIVGEYGVVSHDDGSLRGVRYTADGTINPRLIYDALMKFLSL